MIQRRAGDNGTGWRTALVVGLGKSGLAAARLLSTLGVEVRGYDRRELSEPPAGMTTFSGDAPPPEAFADIDVLVLSPGVPPEPILALADAHAPTAEIHGELGLALTLIDRGVRDAWPPTRTVLVTGTNGKSTVTALTGALLAASGRKVFTGGNLGDPLCDLLTAALDDPERWPHDLVIECSSFQLETMPPLLHDVAMLLNVTPDHLDRYRTLRDYAETKARVFAGLRPDGLALLLDADAWTDALAPELGTVHRVGAADGPRVEGDALVLPEGESIPREALGLPGGHNAVNAVFALTAARHLGVELGACREALAAFEGLPHRMSFVRELDGVAYYNDSKATNVASALASLGGLDRPFVLIAGGKGKGDDLTPLKALLAARGRGMVAIGETAAQLVEVVDGVVPTERAEDLVTAVTRARAMAGAGEAVVLAPACASYDQFDNYAHRGDVFTQAVLALR